MPRRRTIANVLTLTGLIAALVGAVITAQAVILKPDDAVAIGVMRINGDTREQNLQLPAVKNLIDQSNAAKHGLWLIALGTVLQIVGTGLTLRG